MSVEDLEKKEIMTEAEENDLIIKLKDPITFEGEKHVQIDLTKLHDIKAADMVEVNRRLTRRGNTATTQELTLEYALNIANIVTGLPLEFFEQLPPYAALAIRGRVTGFLFGQE